MARGRSLKLNKKRLDYKKQVDLNFASRTEGAIITATEFNPKHHVGLVAGLSSTVVGAASLFKVSLLTELRMWYLIQKQQSVSSFPSLFMYSCYTS